MKDLSNNVVVHKNINGFQYLQFKKLLEFSDTLVHAYSLGIDKNYRTSLNIKNNSLELYSKAIDNYKELCKNINCTYTNLVKPNQSHTNIVKLVKSKINNDKPDFNLDEYNLTDGLITNKSNLLLVTTNADCILLLFFDPVEKVVANVHSGWKGTIRRISVETVQKMKKEYNCKPENIICCICPSIRKCHFEVEKDVQALFKNEFKQELQKANRFNEIIERKTEQKWVIDTVEINKIILQNEGIKANNILDCGICSVCNCDLIHSYRVEKESYGLETALIGLK